MSTKLGKIISQLLGSNHEFVAEITDGIKLNLDKQYTRATLFIGKLKVNPHVDAEVFLTLHDCGLGELTGPDRTAKKIIILDKLVSANGVYRLEHESFRSSGPRKWLLADDWCTLLERVNDSYQEIRGQSS